MNSIDNYFVSRKDLDRALVCVLQYKRISTQKDKLFSDRRKQRIKNMIQQLPDGFYKDAIPYLVEIKLLDLGMPFKGGVVLTPLGERIARRGYINVDDAWFSTGEMNRLIFALSVLSLIISLVGFFV